MSFVVDTVFALLNVFLWCALLIARPTRFVCPRGWHDDGARRDGRLTCTRTPVGPMDWDGTYYDGVQREERSVVPPGVIAGRVYCTGGAMPVVVDERVVSCQAGARWQD